MHANKIQRERTSFKISMVPRVILVLMERAWKKDVFSGPMVVTVAGIHTSTGAIAPALAGALTLLEVQMSRTAPKSPLVKTKPMFLTIKGNSLQNVSGKSSMRFVMEQEGTELVKCKSQTKRAQRDAIHYALVESWVGLQVVLADAGAHHGVLSEQELTASAELDADLLHLGRTDVVDADDEELVVLAQEAIELGEVLDLALRIDPISHCSLTEFNSLRPEIRTGEAD
jgi:hypothetical protein